MSQTAFKKTSQTPQKQIIVISDDFLAQDRGNAYCIVERAPANAVILFESNDGYQMKKSVSGFAQQKIAGIITNDPDSDDHDKAFDGVTHITIMGKLQDGKIIEELLSIGSIEFKPAPKRCNNAPMQKAA